MAGKLKFLAGLGAGYVLGSRQGREQYDKIVAKAQSLWGNPKVQDAAEKVQHVAEEKVGGMTGSSSSSGGSSSTSSADSSDFGSSSTGSSSTGSTSTGSSSTGSSSGGSSSGGLGGSSTGGSSTGGPA